MNKQLFSFSKSDIIHNKVKGLIILFKYKLKTGSLNLLVIKNTIEQNFVTLST